MKYIKELTSFDIQSKADKLINMEYIKDIFADITDEEFSIEWNYHIYEKSYIPGTLSQYNFQRTKIIDVRQNDIMDEILLPNVKYYLGIIISLFKPSVESSEDLTNSFRRALKMMQNLDIQFIDITMDEYRPGSGRYDRKLDINKIQIINGKILYDNKHNYNFIDINFIDPDSEFVLTNKGVAEYYEWEGYLKDGENIYFDIPYSDIIPTIIQNDDVYLDILIDNEEMPWDYHSSYYFPDNDDILYYLNDELIQKILEYANTKYQINSLTYEEKRGWEWIKSFKSIIDQMSNEDDEIITEIKNIISDYLSQAHESKNIKETLDQFESLLSNKITYEIYEINNTKRIKVFFDVEWLDVENPRMGEYLFDIYQEWVEKEKFNPQLSDFGNVDKRQIASEILSLFK